MVGTAEQNAKGGLMTFDKLAPNWPDLPVAGEQHIADLLDLMVSPRARMNGALLVLVCDDQLRPIQPILIEDSNGDVPRPPYVTELLCNMAAGVARSFPGATALVALGREGGLTPSVMDRAWHRSIREAFAGRVEPIGVYVITPRGSVPLTGRAAA